MTQKNQDILDDLRRQIEEGDRFPSPPGVLQSILSVIEDPNASARDIESIVEMDQSCSVRLLKLANSAFYGFSRQIKTIKEAVIIIGLAGVKNVVVSLGIAECFLKTGVSNRQFVDDLWIHSMAVATLSQSIAKRNRKIPGSLTYCAGLVHDFAKVILSDHFREDYRVLFDQALEQKVSLCGAEKAVLGVDHATVGSWIGKAWALPDPICANLTRHHQTITGDSPEDLSIMAVQTANAVAYLAGVGNGGDGKPMPITDLMKQHLDITDEVIEELVKDVQSKANRFTEVLHAAT